jgi:hypothetical protein
VDRDAELRDATGALRVACTQGDLGSIRPAALVVAPDVLDHVVHRHVSRPRAQNRSDKTKAPHLADVDALTVFPEASRAMIDDDGAERLLRAGPDNDLQ